MHRIPLLKDQVPYMLSAMALYCVAALFPVGAFGQMKLPEYKFSEADLEQYDKELAEELRMIQHYHISKEERTEKVNGILARENIPAEVRKKLTIRLANEMKGNKRVAEIYISLLDPKDPLQDAALRGRILYLLRDNIETFAERKKLMARLEEVIGPLLDVPKEKYTLDAIRAVAYYADIIRESGYAVPLSIERARHVETRRAIRRIWMAQVWIYYAQDALSIFQELVELVEARIREEKPSFETKDLWGRIDNPLLNLRGSLQYDISRANSIVERGQKILEDSGTTSDRSVAEKIIEKLLLGSSRESVGKSGLK